METFSADGGPFPELDDLLEGVEDRGGVEADKAAGDTVEDLLVVAADSEGKTGDLGIVYPCRVSESEHKYTTQSEC